MTQDHDGLSRQHIPDDYMNYWREYGWTDHEIKHDWSLSQVTRGDDGKIIRSDRKGNTRSLPAVAAKAARKALIADRQKYRGQVCLCLAYANHRPLCPMRRPSRSPHYNETPWVWSHGDGLGRCVDPTNHAPHQCLTEDDYMKVDDVARDTTEREWRRLDANHRLKIHNRTYHQGGASSSAGQLAEEAEEVNRTRESPRQEHRQVKYRDVHVEYIDDDEDAKEAAKKVFEAMDAKGRKASVDKEKTRLTSVSPTPSLASRGRSKKRSSSLEAESPKAAKTTPRGSAGQPAASSTGAASSSGRPDSSRRPLPARNQRLI